ncbi:Helicase C-terminal [Trinorchestia longiramus]|nr:Helicase C-terminal [Trinorchestia longiramus]
MRRDSTSPVLRSSRGRHHKRKFSRECTSGRHFNELKCSVPNVTVEQEAFQNLESLQFGSCMLVKQTLEGEEVASVMKKCTPKLESHASGSSNSTPQQRKKQKRSFTPQAQDGKSVCEESANESRYNSALDDTLMTCNIDCILEELEMEEKKGDVVEPHTPNENFSRRSGSDRSRKEVLIGKKRSTIGIVPKMMKNTSLQHPVKSLANASSHPCNRNCFSNKICTSPNRYQMKVRRKLSTEPEKHQSSNKSSSHAVLDAKSSLVCDPHSSKKLEVNSKLFHCQQANSTKTSSKLLLKQPSECVEAIQTEKSSLDDISAILQDSDLFEAFDDSFNLCEEYKGTKIFNQPGECSPDLFADAEFSSSENVDPNNQLENNFSVLSSNKVLNSSQNLPCERKVPLSEVADISMHKSQSSTVNEHVTLKNKIAPKESCPVKESKENIAINKPMVFNTKKFEAKNFGDHPKEFFPVHMPVKAETPEGMIDEANLINSSNLLKGINDASPTNSGAPVSKIYRKSHSSTNLNVDLVKSRPAKIDSSSVITSLPQGYSSKIHGTAQTISHPEPTNLKRCSTSSMISVEPSSSKVSEVPEINSVTKSCSEKVYNASQIKSPSVGSLTKDHNTSSEVQSPGANSSMTCTLGSDCSTLESQNLLQKMHGKLCSSTQSTPGSAHTTQISSLNSSAVRRNAAVTTAVQLVQEAAAPDAAVGHELGPYFGLPGTVQDLFEKYRGITRLYDWQSECINLGLDGSNLLISLPTSGGKTLVAEVLMLRTLLVRKKHAIFLLPYVAIVQEKVRGLAPLAVDLDFLLEEYAGSRGSYPPKKRRRKSVAFVATTEKANGLISSFLEERRADEVGLVVVDEAHMLGEPGGRGALLESTITKLRHSAKHVQIVAMSATISNLHQLSEFLGAKLYTGNFRPVKLRQFVKMNDMVSEINAAAHTDEELLFNHRSVDYGYSSSERAMDQDGIAGLVREVIPNHSVLVFCPTRRNCESLAKLLCSLLPYHLTKHNRQQKEALYMALVKEGTGTVCPVLKQVLPYGLAYHHSGLTEGERKLIEEGYLSGTLCLITCTSTLAAGVNLPARRVILRSPYTGRDPLTRSRYMQMVGRAGRAGLDSEGESFLIMQQKDARMIPDLVRGPVETCLSRLCDAANESMTPYSHATACPPPQAFNRRLGSSAGTAASTPTSTAVSGSSSSSQRETILTSSFGLRDLMFSSIGLGLVSNLAEVLELVECSLMALQAQQRNINLRSVVVDVLERLRSYGMLRIKGSVAAATPPSDLESKSQSSACDSGVTNSGHSALSPCTSPTFSSSIRFPGDPDTAEGLLEDLSDPSSRIRTALLPHHILVVSRLGRAAIKGCVELSIANRLYEDLMLARSSLAVHSRLHLLYLVTPYSAAHELPLVPQAFYQAYCRLMIDEVQTAELIGVSEAVASQVAMGKTKMLSDDVVKRFNAAMILHRLLSGEDVWNVSDRFEVPRGLLQRTLAAAAAFASCVHHFCKELEELWAFRDLLVSFSRQLSGCCSAHLLPLLDLPAVKLGRAQVLYTAGYTTLLAVAKARPDELIKVVHHLSTSTATHIVESAKALLLEQAEVLTEEAEQFLLGLKDFSSAPSSAASTSSRV